MGYGSGFGGFLQGLTEGGNVRFQRDQTLLANKRQQEQTDLNERRVRNQELDSVQREARRVAEQDRADEQQTMQMLMQPGLTEESRNAIKQARVNRRNDNMSYIRSLSADPTNAADITKRFGDITKLITPSTVESGVLPSPTIDMIKATTLADSYRKEIGELPEAKRAAEVKYRQGLLGTLGLNPEQIQQLLPDYGKVVGTTKGKVSDWEKVDVPFNLPENLMFGGKQYDEKLGRTIETQLGPDGKTLQKRYIAPDVEQTMTYEPSAVTQAKMDKYKYEGPRIQAQIAKLNAETAAIPKRTKIQADRLLATIKNNEQRNAIAKLLVGIKRDSNNIRAWGLQRADERGQASLGLRARMVNVAEGRLKDSRRAEIQSSSADLRKQLNDYEQKFGRATDEQRTAEGGALRGVIEAIRQQIETNDAMLAMGDSDSGLDQFVASEGLTYVPPTTYPGYGAVGGYPGYGYGGGGYVAPTPGSTTYGTGGVQYTPQQIAAILAQNSGGGGVSATQKKSSPVYYDKKTGKPIDPKTLTGKAGKTAGYVTGGAGHIQIAPPVAETDLNDFFRFMQVDAATRAMGGMRL